MPIHPLLGLLQLLSTLKPVLQVALTTPHQLILSKSFCKTREPEPNDCITVFVRCICRITVKPVKDVLSQCGHVQL
jgi:hypothetical protein